LRDRRENGQETDSRIRNGPANNFSGGNETLSKKTRNLRQGSFVRLRFIRKKIG
jgi:hypothetical protein